MIHKKQSWGSRISEKKRLLLHRYQNKAPDFLRFYMSESAEPDTVLEQVSPLSAAGMECL